MDKYINIEFTLYGALSEYTHGSEPIIISAKKGIEVKNLRANLIGALKDKYPAFAQEDIVYASAFANATTILSDEASLDDDCHLSILPPVCGG